MDQVVRASVENRTFMGTVLVARGNDILLSRGYGMANLEWEIPNAPSTKFRLGSITKQFTAAAVLLLEERGRIRTSDPIRTHLPDLPAAWDAITVHHLLTHTAGVVNFTSLPEYQGIQVTESPVAKTIDTIREKPLEFAPGSKMSYSNSGYLVLGRLIEVVSGTSYAAFVRDNIFLPIGMRDSGYDSNADVIPRRAAGYTPSPSGAVNASFIHMTIPHAAGALYSTTEDLLRWQQALFAGRVVSDASLKKMTTPVMNNYAYGLIARRVDDRAVIEHGGGINGFNTVLRYYPDTRVTIAVLANINGPAVNQLANALGTIAHGGSVTLASERKVVALPAGRLAALAGNYELAPGAVLTIIQDGDRLMAQLTGQGRNEIFPASETRFFLKVVDADIEFVADAAGTISHLVLHQNGQSRKAVKR